MLFLGCLSTLTWIKMHCAAYSIAGLTWINPDARFAPYDVSLRSANLGPRTRGTLGWPTPRNSPGLVKEGPCLFYGQFLIDGRLSHSVPDRAERRIRHVRDGHCFFA